MSSSSDSPDARVPESRLAGERLETQLARIEERWRVERKRHEQDYSGEGEGRNPELPSAFRTIWGVVFGLGFIAFGVWHVSMGGPGPISIGVFLLLAGIWGASLIAWRHRRYVLACRDYQRRRAEVLSTLGEPGRTNG